MNPTMLLLTVLGVVLAVLAGTCLTLWLCLSVVERTISRITASWTQSADLMLARLLNQSTVGPPEVPETPQSEGFYTQSMESDPEDLPPWAVGMTDEDLRDGVDPWTGRPLR